MYRRPRFLEILIAIREEMARDADFDVDLFVEMARNGKGFEGTERHSMENYDSNANHRPTRRTLTKRNS
jgi:hypothetical protein